MEAPPLEYLVVKGKWRKDVMRVGKRGRDGKE